MWHLTVSADSQLECWLTACRGIPTSGPLETVHGGMQENPDVIRVIHPQKCPFCGDLNPHQIVLWAHPSPQFSHFCRAHDCYKQTDRSTDKPTNHATVSVPIGRIYVVLWCGLIMMTPDSDNPQYFPMLHQVGLGSTENAGLENEGPDCTGRTIKQHIKMISWHKNYHSWSLTLKASAHLF